MAFLKGSSDPNDKMPGCTNLDKHYGGCFFDRKNCSAETCNVQEGKRCEYFEKAVLPSAAELGLKEHLNRLYGKHVGTEIETICGGIRYCPDCETELALGQRYCEPCRQKRRRITYRNSRNKKAS